MASQTKVLEHRFHATTNHAIVDVTTDTLSPSDLKSNQLGFFAVGPQPSGVFKDSAGASAFVSIPMTATVEILAAAVATLNATPVTLIAAPGAGYYVDVHRIHWMLDHQGVDYDAAAAGEDLAVSYTNAAGDEVVSRVDHSGFGDASADAHAIVQAIDCVPVANAAVVAHLLVGEWYGAAGDGNLQAQIDYTIRALDLGA